MFRTVLSGSVVGVLLSAAAATGAEAASSPLGVWINDEGRGAIEISQCGKNLCGKLVWLKDTNDAKGCGLQIIGNLKQTKAGTWDNGWIYSPDSDSKFDVELKTLRGDKLRVLGYAGTKMFGKTMIWTRAPADIKRCGTTEAALQPADAAKTGTEKVVTGDRAIEPQAAPKVEAKADVKDGATAAGSVAAEEKITDNPTSPAVNRPAESKPARPVVPPSVLAKAEDLTPQQVEPVETPVVQTPPENNAPEVKPEVDATAVILPPAPKVASKADAPEKSVADSSAVLLPPAPKAVKVKKSTRTASRDRDCTLNVPFVTIRFRCNDDD